MDWVDPNLLALMLLALMLLEWLGFLWCVTRCSSFKRLFQELG